MTRTVWLRWSMTSAMVALASAACSDDETAGKGAAGQNEQEASLFGNYPEPGTVVDYGEFFIGSYPGYQGGHLNQIGGFFMGDVPWLGRIVWTRGPCRLTEVVDPWADDPPAWGPEVDVGTLTVNGIHLPAEYASASQIQQRPEIEFYTYSPIFEWDVDGDDVVDRATFYEGAPIFLPGETVSVAAPGNPSLGIPAFHWEVIAPGNIEGVWLANSFGEQDLVELGLQEDAVVDLDREAPHTVRWTGDITGTDAIVRITLATDTTSMECRFDSRAGTGVIPPEALADLPPGEVWLWADGNGLLEGVDPSAPTFVRFFFLSSGFGEWMATLH